MTAKKIKKNFLTKRLLNVIIIMLAVLFLFMMFFLSIELNLINNPFSNILQEPQKFEIPDQCSIIAGQVIHTIENEDSCRIICRAQCETRNLEFYDSEFHESLEECHLCDCYCN